MALKSPFISYLSIAIAAAQTTYTGCHMHGSVSYCYAPNGQETPVTTIASVSSAIPASAIASTTAEAQTTAVTSCHLHATNVFCINGKGAEVSISLTGTPTGSIPAQYTSCHSHGSGQYCVDPQGNDVSIVGLNDASSGSEEHDHGEEGLDCHFHAGVEHCVASGESEGSAEASCDAPSARDYNIGLRVGSIFIILVTSGLAVFGPLLIHKLPFGKINTTLFTIIKQFGTGIIISTAFVHLFTHAFLMFNNRCLKGIDYEGTTAAVVMAGLFVAFLVEYFGYRFVLSKDSKKKIVAESSTDSEQGSTVVAEGKTDNHSNSALQDISHSHSPSNFDPNTVLAVSVMEAGILFHSVLIGLTLVVAPDNSANTSGYYNTLLAVIVFHQFFEGLALGARIALLPTSSLSLGKWSKILMAGAFTLITPLGKSSTGSETVILTI